jgi:hypothetical protein
MTQNRPTAVLVIAILHFIVGGLGLLQSVCGGVLLLSGGMEMMAKIGGPQAAHQIEVMEGLPYYKFYMVGNLVVDLVFDMMLLAAGFGLLRMRAWAHKLSIAYAVTSILHKVIIAIYTFSYLLAIYDHLPPFAANQPGTQEVQRMVAVMQKAVAGATPFITMIYPLAVLVIMLWPAVRSAFGGGVSPPPMNEAIEQIEEDDRWGRG